MNKQNLSKKKKNNVYLQEELQDVHKPLHVERLPHKAPHKVASLAVRINKLTNHPRMMFYNFVPQCTKPVKQLLQII